MSTLLLANWSANFDINDDHENERLKEAQNELASLISCLNLGSEEMPIEEYVQLGGKICRLKVKHG